MKRSSAWLRLRAELRTSESRDFERRILPLLRLNWPTIAQATAQGAFDRSGIDLLEVSSTGEIGCVVQCKGFRVLENELGASQIAQVQASVDSFVRSGHSCHQYILIYNRDARQRDFHHAIQQIVSSVQEEGRAERAEAWDVETLLLSAQQYVKNHIDTCLRERSSLLLSEFQKLFEFGHCHVEFTPVEERLIRFRRGEPCTIDGVARKAPLDVSKLIISPTEARWSLVTGMFGSGKTTSSLHAALAQSQIVIYAPCKDFPTHKTLVSTNVLMEAIVTALQLFSDWPADEQLRLGELAGPLLANLLRQDDSEYALIIDGLDENRFYSRLQGMEFLSNQIAELRCPIIITTRDEHLSSLFGDFSAAFESFSTKFGPKRDARWFALQQWDGDQTSELISCAISQSSGSAQENLAALLGSVACGESEKLYGDLVYNPLFLQFILEDVAETGVQASSRVELIARWTRRKLRRDRTVTERLTLGDELDLEEFVEQAIHLMEDVAARMVLAHDDRYELVETVSPAQVVKLAEGRFTDTKVAIVAVLLNSLLVPHTSARGRLRTIRFPFQILHEFFLASYLTREEIPHTGFPVVVCDFAKEMVLPK